MRGEFFLDLNFRENWYDELDGMNCGKGCKCKFPHSLTRLLIIRKQFIDYRCLDSIMTKLFHMDLIPKVS
ncbi:MAG: IS5/IS1182 family transposase, partial [Thermoplasmatales archaeon]